MDDLVQVSDPPVVSSAPQIRSRITVVCAECKRLKLKCDRRTPCGSCTKRGTVPRCVYSSAAAEKVDLHSLNNRLMQVEATLAMVTAGQTPPPFQSSYPLVQGASPVPSATKFRPTFSVPSSSSHSISIRFTDLENTWLAHPQFDSYEKGSPGASRVKVEPSLMDDLLPLTASSEPSFTHPWISSASSAQFSLPPLHTYYPPASSSSSSSPTTQYEPPARRTTSKLQSTSYDIPPSVHAPLPTQKPPASNLKPVATAALLAFLPSPAARLKLLNRARLAHPHIALIVPWSRLVDLADPNGKEERTRKAALADAVFFSGNRNTEGPLGIQRQISSTSADDSGLPLFNTLCYVLAIGALETLPDETPLANPAFLHALAGQALNLWEEYRTSTNYQVKSVYREASRRRESVDELDHLVACLLQVKYLLRVGFLSMANQTGVTNSTVEAVFPLVGRLVNLAHSLDLAHVPENTDALVSRGVRNKERRRLIWWDIMFYDAFVSDALGHPSSVSLLSYSTSLPTIAQPSGPVASDLSGTTVNCSSPDHRARNIHMPDLQTDVFTEPCVENAIPRRKTPPLSTSDPPWNGKRKARSLSQPDDESHGFFGVRCQLTRLVQVVKHRLASPGCECCTCGRGSGYTLDQAVALEGEVRNWLEDLPAQLKVDPELEPFFEGTRPTKHAALANELFLVANRLITLAYMPFVFRTIEAGTSEASRASTYGTHLWSPPSRATAHAAQCILRSAQELYRLSIISRNENPMPMTGDYYSLVKAVLDATVICAFVAFGTETVKTQGSKRVDDIKLGLDLLSAIGYQGVEMERIVSTLKKRLEGVSYRQEMRSSEGGALKRKHSQLEGPRAEEHTHPGLTLALDQASEPCEDRPSLPSPPGPSIKSSTRIAPVSRAKISYEKDREKKRRGSPHPPVGVRDRGKDGPSWMKKPHPVSSKRLADGIINPTRTEPPSPHFLTSPTPQTSSRHVASFQMDSEEHTALSKSSFLLDTHSQVPPTLESGRPEVHLSQRRRLTRDIGPPSQQDAHGMQQLFNASATILCPSSSVVTPPGFLDPVSVYRSSLSHNSLETGSVYGSEQHSFSQSPPSTQSPFGMSGGPPHTPSYDSGSGLASHCPSPPIFGPRPSTATAYQMQAIYDGPFDNRHQSTATDELPVGVRTNNLHMMDLQLGPVPGPAVLSQMYEKLSHLPPKKQDSTLDHQLQHVHFDFSGPSDLQSRHQHQQQMVDMSDQHMWSSNMHYPQPQGVIAQLPRYWSPTGYFP